MLPLLTLRFSFETPDCLFYQLFQDIDQSRLADFRRPEAPHPYTFLYAVHNPYDFGALQSRLHNEVLYRKGGIPNYTYYGQNERPSTGFWCGDYSYGDEKNESDNKKVLTFLLSLNQIECLTNPHGMHTRRLFGIATEIVLDVLRHRGWLVNLRLILRRVTFD